MRTNFILWFVITIFIFGCNSTKDQLTGHWISVGYFNGERFLTIDFENEVYPSPATNVDTVYHLIVFDKNNLASGYGKAYLSKEEDTYKFFLPHDLEGHFIVFKNDSLFIKGETFNDVLVKADLSKTIYKELFNYSDLKIQLKNDSSGNKHLQTPLDLHLNIGYQSNNNTDSIFINYEDVYVDITDLPRVINEAKSMVAEQDREKLKIFINADQAISDEFIHTLFLKLKDTDSAIHIYRTSFDYKNGLLYETRL